MPDRIVSGSDFSCLRCGYWNHGPGRCGLIPEHRDILCPFGDACPAAPEGAALEKGGGEHGDE